jgi:hypothetical protein
LLELGLFGPTGKMIVYCPEGYWRKGNVDVTCSFFNIKQVNTFEDFLSTIIAEIPRNLSYNPTQNVYRSAVRLAKQKKDDYYTGGFDIMKKLFKKQHKHQDIKHQSAVRESPTSKLEWEARYEHNRDVQAAWCESEGIPVPKEKEYGVLEKVPGYWKSFKANLFWPALKKRGHDKVEYALCKCCHDKSGFGKNYIKRVILP